jgi:[protein-PII] uridylyltransferase
VSPGVVVRDRRIVLDADAAADASLVLRAAVAAAQRRVAIDRPSLERLAGAPSPVWSTDERDAFLALLGAGRDALPVLDALDHAGVLAHLLPEWEHVRSRPQRNAYHRYTVDRHLLETVAECAALLAEEGFDGAVARECDRDVLLLGALLHDVAKGREGDHSVIGAQVAGDVGARLGLDARSVETLAWLVTNHLVLAETATRRDLSDDATIARVARLAGTPARLDLLYTLTIGDSRATGPAAWSAAKAALVRELYVKTRAALEGATSIDGEERSQRRAALAARVGEERAARLLDGFPDAYVAAFDADELAHHASLIGEAATVVEWDDDDEHDEHDEHVRCTVVARDRPGLLAAAATALAVHGLDVRHALAFTHRDGHALDVFTVVDRFRRLDDPSRRADVGRRVADALDEDADMTAALTDHARRYAPGPAADAHVRVDVDVDTSLESTIVEVHAPDRPGLLAQLARALERADLDVRIAKVETLADRVVDAFYVRNRDGTKPTDAARLDALRAALQAELATT